MLFILNKFIHPPFYLFYIRIIILITYLTFKEQMILSLNKSLTLGTFFYLSLFTKIILGMKFIKNH